MSAHVELSSPAARQLAGPISTRQATAALTLAVIGLTGCPLISVLGLVMGILALARARSLPERYGGRGRAVASIWLAAIGFVVMFPLGFLVVFMPTQHAGSQTSVRLVCASNLMGAATSARVYAFDHDGAFPPDLGALVTTGHITPKQLQCPAQGNPADFCDFYYVPGLDADSPQDWILAYEDPANHLGKGGHVVYCSGILAFLKTRELEAELERFRQAYEKDRGRPPKIIPPW